MMNMNLSRVHQFFMAALLMGMAALFFPGCKDDAVECAVEGCIACDEADICVTCESGYTPNDGSCEEDATTTTTTTTAGSSTTTCTDANCATCDGDVDTCTECNSGFNLASGASCVVCSVSDCATCDTDVAVCEACDSGYYVKTSADYCCTDAVADAYALGDAAVEDYDADTCSVKTCDSSLNTELGYWGCLPDTSGDSYVAYAPYKLSGDCTAQDDSSCYAQEDDECYQVSASATAQFTAADDVTLEGAADTITSYTDAGSSVVYDNYAVTEIEQTAAATFIVTTGPVFDGTDGTKTSATATNTAGTPTGLTFVLDSSGVTWTATTSAVIATASSDGIDSYDTATVTQIVTVDSTPLTWSDANGDALDDATDETPTNFCLSTSSSNCVGATFTYTAGTAVDYMYVTVTEITGSDSLSFTPTGALAFTSDASGAVLDTGSTDGTYVYADATVTEITAVSTDLTFTADSDGVTSWSDTTVIGAASSDSDSSYAGATVTEIVAVTGQTLEISTNGPTFTESGSASAWITLIDAATATGDNMDNALYNGVTVTGISSSASNTWTPSSTENAAAFCAVAENLACVGATITYTPKDFQAQAGSNWALPQTYCDAYSNCAGYFFTYDPPATLSAYVAADADETASTYCTAFGCVGADIAYTVPTLTAAVSADTASDASTYCALEYHAGNNCVGYTFYGDIPSFTAATAASVTDVFYANDYCGLSMTDCSTATFTISLTQAEDTAFSADGVAETAYFAVGSDVETSATNLAYVASSVNGGEVLPFNCICMSDYTPTVEDDVAVSCDAA